MKQKGGFMYRDLLSGDLITYEILSLREMPLPDDNWYADGDLEDDPHYGMGSFSLFALVNDGGSVLRWFPVEVMQ